MRLRIAPSPTGYLHVGTARAALYNWLLARQKGGIFILRIEDTDKVRSKKEYENDIMRHLKWLGLTWDEEYRQSERYELYRKALLQLLSEKKVYISYDEPHVEGDRRPADTRAFRKNAVFEFQTGKQGGVVRFMTPDHEEVVCDDMVRGPIHFNTDDIEDFSIAKGLDEPLYNFVVTVDDIDLGITDVIRGEDHISNTPKQMLLYKALGHTPPRFGHLPLLLATDRSKLSKRKGTTSMKDFVTQGFLPEAMVNYLALLGWHLGASSETGRASAADQEFFTLDELVKVFSMDRVRKSNSVFDMAKLRYFNSHYIKALPLDDLLKRLEPYYEQQPHVAEIAGATNHPLHERFRRAVQVEQSRAELLSDLVTAVASYRDESQPCDPAMLHWKIMTTEETIASLQHSKSLIAGLRGDEELAELQASLLQKAGEYKQGDRGALLWPLRVALSNKEKSPSPFELVWVLGKDESCDRIEGALARLRT